MRGFAPERAPATKWTSVNVTGKKALTPPETCCRMMSLFDFEFRDVSLNAEDILALRHRTNIIVYHTKCLFWLGIVLQTPSPVKLCSEHNFTGVCLREDFIFCYITTVPEVYSLWFYFLSVTF